MSFGGASRLLPASDGWFALTLAREDDLALVPALVGDDDIADPWPAIAEWSADLPVADIVARGVLLGLPIGALGEVSGKPRAIARALPVSSLEGVVVVDLSSLWAGPLCGALLAEAGAEVIKVESTTRPDGARRGDPAVYERLNGRKRHVSIDFTRDELLPLLRKTDVVIEASRPRALRDLGIDADALIADGDVRAWASITGYGRAHDRVAFGDDAAVAGGLVAYDNDGPLFRGDAIADPLTGVAAATAITTALESDEPQLLDIAMAQIAAAAPECSE